METPKTYGELQEMSKHAKSSEERLELLHNFVCKDKALRVISILETDEGILTCLYDGDYSHIDLQGMKKPVTRLVTKEEVKWIQESALDRVQSILRRIKNRP